MKQVALLLSAALALTACEPAAEGEPVTRTRIDGQAGPISETPTPSENAASGTTQVESACRSVIFEDTPLTHCLATPARHSVAMDLGPSSGGPYRSLTRFSSARSSAGIAFAMNAGMYDEEGQPIGYYVEEGERLQTLNTADGSGNFYSKPNGVFFGTDDSWQVLTTEDFLANVRERPDFGTQSGPMLVIDGALHPDIQNDGESRFIRNAVGVDKRGRAHFVISNGAISFGKLARFYRDELNVENALYLDGNVSALWNPSTDRLDTGAPIGPIVYVSKKGPSE